MSKRGRPRGRRRGRINLSFSIPVLVDLRETAKRTNIPISRTLERAYRKYKRER